MVEAHPVKHSLFDKSYKILFVIYAPIAIGTYLYTFFTGARQSFIFLCAGVAAAASFILGLVILILFLLHRDRLPSEQTASIPFLLQPRFLIYYLPAALLSFGVTAGFLVVRPGTLIEVWGQPVQAEVTPIAVLLHARDPYGRPWTETEQTVQGFGKFLLDKPEVTSRYHFKFFDHHNSYGKTVEEFVAKEMKHGTRYFVCLSSEVCEPLSHSFARLAVRSGVEKDQPILINTVATSTEILTRPNYSYRFYPRSIDQAELLARIARRNKLGKASWVSVDNLYGHQLTAAFSKAFRQAGGEIEDGIYLNPANTTAFWRERVRNSQIDSTRVDALLVGHYEDINGTLAMLRPSITILLPMGYIDFYRSASGAALRDRSVIGILPVFRPDKLNFNNIQGTFLYYTLDKLVHTLDVTGHDRKLFHSTWMETTYPPQVAFERVGDADFRILMRPAEVDRGVLR